MLIPAVSVLAAITLMPALLAMLGERINSVRLMPKRFVDDGHPEDGAWGRWARFVLRRPVGGRGRRARDRGRARRARHAAQPERVAAEELPRHRHRDRRAADARRRRHHARRDEAVRDPRRARRRRAGGRREGARPCRASSARPCPAAPAGTAARTRSSRRSRRSTARRRGSRASSTASTTRSREPTRRSAASPAVDRDFVHAVYGNFPYVLAFVLILTLILLTRAFRSIVLPIKAAILNLLSLARGVRDRRVHLPDGPRLVALEHHRDAGDHRVDPADDLRVPVRPLDGLRGLHALAHARGVRRDRLDTSARSSSASRGRGSSSRAPR